MVNHEQEVANKLCEYLFQIDPKEFEYLIAALLDKIRFENVEVVVASGGCGIDLVADLTVVGVTNVKFKAGILFSIPSFAGVFVARHLLLPNLPDIIYSHHGVTITKALVVMGSFAILMVLASRAMIRSGQALQVAIEEKASLLSIGWNGFLVGATTGFVGAGGGFLIIPALVILLKFQMKIAVVTSLAIIAANSLFGFTISMS